MTLAPGGTRSWGLLRPASLIQVTCSVPSAVAVAGGEPVGQTRVGQDDPLPQDGVTADRVLEQPVGPGGLGPLGHRASATSSVGRGTTAVTGASPVRRPRGLGRRDSG